MAAHRMSLVEVDGVPEVERLHAAGQGSAVDLEHEVVMRSHQTEADARPLKRPYGSHELAQERGSVDVVSKERRRRPDAVGEDVEETRSGIAWQSRHRTKMLGPPTLAPVSFAKL